MDPLSDVLSLLKPVSLRSAGFDAGGSWALRFIDQIGTIKCGAVITGRCHVRVDGVAESVCLEAGDSFLLPTGRPFEFASEDGVEVRDAQEVLPLGRQGSVSVVNGGGDCFIVSSRFKLDGEHASLLVGILPPIVLLRGDQNLPTLRWPVERMMQELRDEEPGSFLILQHLAHMILVQGLRQHLQRGLKGGEVGWMFALADRQIGAAIGAMHGDPAFRWTIETLASKVGMSRSVFAARFRDLVGVAPMEYLTRWRMLKAAERLAATNAAVSTVALAAGYESESAFSTAFKRVMGCSPRRYVRQRSDMAAVA